MTHKLAPLVLILLFAPFSAEAACIFGGGAAGQSAGYHYAVAYINSITAADAGLKRISKTARDLKPADDYPGALASFSNALKEYELAARDFECAASLVQRQEKFSPGGSSKLENDQTRVARMTASLAKMLYLQLAKEARAIASIFSARMKDSITDVEFAEQAAKGSANLDDIPRELFSSSPGVTHALIDPRPDASNHVSRLRITGKERDDLIAMLEREFGEKIIGSSKKGGPAMESIAAILRDWLATNGHVPAR
jgi:hypothetical protein